MATRMDKIKTRIASTSREKSEEHKSGKRMKLKCALCPFSTIILHNYKAHMKVHSNDKPFKCPECPYRSKWGNGVKRHLKDVHVLDSPASRPFPCQHPGCSYAAKQKGNLMFHSKIHSGEKSLVCSHSNCNYSTNNKRHLIEHVRVHTREKPYKCEFESCSYVSATASSLVAHSRIHTKEKPFKCPEPNCEYSTTQSSHLKTHRLTHEPNEGEERPLFPCPLCEYTGKSQLHLSSHAKIHSLETAFACPFESCDYRCKFSSNLGAHLKSIHSDEKPYKCELCPFRGKTRFSVTGHLKRVHADSGLRPFKCTEPNCQYAAKLRDGLRKHLVTHSEEKKHACSFADCNYKAHRQGHVKEHEYRIHNKGKK